MTERWWVKGSLVPRKEMEAAIAAAERKGMERAAVIADGFHKEEYIPAHWLEDENGKWWEPTRRRVKVTSARSIAIAIRAEIDEGR